MKAATEIAVLLAGAVLASTAGHAAGRPANIVVIMADDLGYNELSCYGQTMFQTPRIDRLAAEGMRFTDFYAGNTVCAPSRASLWTGRHPGNVSIRGNKGLVSLDPLKLDRVGVGASEKTIGEVMQQRGYKTALCGKWHLEYFEDRAVTWPINRGFDYVIRERWGPKLQARWKAYEEESGVTYDYNYPYELWENGQLVTIPGNLEGEQAHLMDDLVAEKGLEFIRENRDEPFFVFFSLKIPHIPETYSADRGRFKDRGWPEGERIHAVRIGHLDDLVGRIVDHLDNLGLAENTLILFSSDNGGHREGGYLGEKIDPWKHDHTFFKSNHPLRGAKRDLYEGGIRVPTIARWKGTIEAGSESAHVAAFWDLLATFAEVTGRPERDYANDGLSFLPTLLGRPQKKHSHLYWEFTQLGQLSQGPSYGFSQAVRFGDIKAVRNGVRAPIEIYDLSNDLSESHDLSPERPDLVSRAEALLQSSRSPSDRFPLGGGAAIHSTYE